MRTKLELFFGFEIIKEAYDLLNLENQNLLRSEAPADWPL